MRLRRRDFEGRRIIGLRLLMVAELIGNRALRGKHGPIRPFGRMRMRQDLGRLARPAGLGQGLAIGGEHLNVVRKFDRQPLQNRDGLRMFGHAAQSPRVIHRDGFVIRIAVVLAAPILRCALTIRVGGAPGAIRYTADRTGDILLTARLAASETKRGRHKRPGDGSGRDVPNPAFVRQAYCVVHRTNVSCAPPCHYAGP